MTKKNSYITATDQFCGAGGTTSGAKAAGIEVKMALNHWEQAIETHIRLLHSPFLKKWMKDEQR